MRLGSSPTLVLEAGSQSCVAIPRLQIYLLRELHPELAGFLTPHSTGFTHSWWEDMPLPRCGNPAWRCCKLHHSPSAAVSSESSLLLYPPNLPRKDVFPLKVSKAELGRRFRRESTYPATIGDMNSNPSLGEVETGGFLGAHWPARSAKVQSSRFHETP